MIDEEVRGKALTFFENGQYEACLDFAGQYVSSHDSSLQIIEALCFIALFRYEEAEVCLRDLRERLPDSAEVCLYLGRVLEALGDDTARALFCEAVRLDLDGQSALRRYAEYLIDEGDTEGAYPVIDSLWNKYHDNEDLSLYSRLLAKCSRYNEVLALISENPIRPVPDYYYEALFKTERYDEIISLFRTENDPDSYIQWYIRAEGRKSIDNAINYCVNMLQTGADTKIAGELLKLFTDKENWSDVVWVYLSYLQSASEPEILVNTATAFYNLGEYDKAATLLESVMVQNIEINTARRVFYKYMEVIKRIPALENRASRFLKECETPTILITQAEYTQDERLFFRAFRADLCIGGIAYAEYLVKSGNFKEFLKIILYMIKTVKKIRGLETIAGRLLSILPEIPESDEILRSLTDRLRPVFPLLSTNGRNVVSELLLCLAEDTRNRGLGKKGEEYCIEALSLIPAGREDKLSKRIFSELMHCKASCFSLPDKYSERKLNQSQDNKPANSVSTITGLETVEEMVLSYLAGSKTCSEMDLRSVAGTVRVAGLMNRIIRKLSMQGLKLINKEGYGESGEIYRYIG